MYHVFIQLFSISVLHHLIFYDQCALSCASVCAQSAFHTDLLRKGKNDLFVFIKQVHLWKDSSKTTTGFTLFCATEVAHQAINRMPFVLLIENLLTIDEY